MGKKILGNSYQNFKDKKTNNQRKIYLFFSLILPFFLLIYISILSYITGIRDKQNLYLWLFFTIVWLCFITLSTIIQHKKKESFVPLFFGLLISFLFALLIIFYLYFFYSYIDILFVFAQINILMLIGASLCVSTIYFLYADIKEIFYWRDWIIFHVLLGSSYGFLIGFFAELEIFWILVIIIVLVIFSLIPIVNWLVIFIAGYFLFGLMRDSFIAEFPLMARFEHGIFYSESFLVTVMGLPLFILPFFIILGYFITCWILHIESVVLPKIVLDRSERKNNLFEYKNKFEGWKSEGYEIPSKIKDFVQTRNTDKKIKKLEELEEQILKLKKIEKNLEFFDKRKYKEEIDSIQNKIKNPNKLDMIELEYLALKLKIQKSKQESSDKVESYYEILGVKPEASQDQIRSVYRKLAKIYHPDVGKHLGIKDDTRFKNINEAYETLIDPVKRKKYDKRKKQ